MSGRKRQINVQQIVKQFTVYIKQCAIIIHQKDVFIIYRSIKWKIRTCSKIEKSEGEGLAVS